MLGRILFVCIGAIIFCHTTMANGVGTTTRESHINMTMRMIGHEVLLAVGDSTSIVRPIVQVDNQYIISFESVFSFVPEVVSAKIDSIMSAMLIAEDYLVEFVSCDSYAILMRLFTVMKS